jgi:hypothetical protein
LYRLHNKEIRFFIAFLDLNLAPNEHFSNEKYKRLRLNFLNVVNDASNYFKNNLTFFLDLNIEYSKNSIYTV